MKNTLFTIHLMLAFIHGAWSQFSIQELSVDNEYYLQDSFGEFPDWIEITNTSQTIASLEGWSLSDDADEMTKWTFPLVHLDPGKSIVVFASGRNIKTSESLHTNFKIGENSEACFLVDPYGHIQSMVPPHALPAGLSYGKYPNVNGDWIVFLKPSPGLDNSFGEPNFFDQNDLIGFSHQAGFYSQAFQLSLTSTREDIDIRYTLNGQPVDHNSENYSGPISIEMESPISATLSYIPTSDTWQKPDQLPTVHLVRVQAYRDSVAIGPEISKTFFVGPSTTEKEKWDVVSLSIDPADFFSDERGIYVHGNSPWGNFAERGEQWERPAYMEYFGSTNHHEIHKTIGVRIHGRSSRYSPQKSLRLIADNKYNTGEIFLPGLNPDTVTQFESILLRAPESLFSTSTYLDDYVQSFLQPLNLDHQGSRPCLLFINGEFWGIHHIRERLDEAYLEHTYGIDPDDVDIIDWDGKASVQYGQSNSFYELMKLLESPVAEDEQYYSAIDDQVDISSFIDYMCAEIYFANEDFPINNVRLWKTPETKWRFFFFDADATMREHHDQILQRLLKSNSNDPVTRLFQALYMQREFRMAFSARMFHLMQSNFHPDALIARQNEMKENHAPFMPMHISRWNRPESMAEWHNALSSMDEFILLRGPHILDDMLDLFEIPLDIYPVPANDHVHLKFYDASLADPTSIVIYDIQGKTMELPTVLNWQDDVITMNISHLPSGLYVMQIRVGPFYTSKKLVVH